MVSAVVCLLGLVGKQMGERVLPVDFTESQQQLLNGDVDERITVELVEHSVHHHGHHPVGLLEMAKVL